METIAGSSPEHLIDVERGKEGQNTFFLIVATFVSSLGGFLFGYDNIVISGAIGYLARTFQLDSLGVGWAAGCALVGCVAGSAGSGWVADRIGLKKSLFLCALCFLGSSIGVFFSHSFNQFVIWRLLGGVGIGAASILAPMYIAEISPARVRGRLVTLYQLGIVVGIFCSVFVNMLIQKSGTEEWNLAVGWKWMFFAGAVPAVLFGFAILPSLESPRWLMKAGRACEATAVLTKINGLSSATKESASIQESLAEEKGRFSELFTGKFRKALIIGVLLAGLTQTSGITPVFSFLPDIFKAAGAQTGDAFFQSVLVSVNNTVFTLFALWLVDRLGRRTLLVAGTGIQFLAFALVGLFYFFGGNPLGVLAGVMAFVGGHAIGNGVVVWVVISEIFPTKVRGRAMSMAITSLWIFSYAANQVFPVLQAKLGNAGVFWVFSAMALVNLMFGLFLLPETKGYSLEEIERIFIRQPAKAI